MKNFLLLFTALLSTTICSIAATPSETKAAASLANKPLLFMENKGQVANLQGELLPEIKFTAHSGGVKLFIANNAIHYQFMKTAGNLNAQEKMKREREKSVVEKEKTELYRLDMKLEGANANPAIATENESDYYENYFLAHCPKDGIMGVHGYTRLVYKDIYPKIDWVIYTNENKMKYDFVVHP